MALVDNLNCIRGPPSMAMAMLQEEFIDEQMEPDETVAFARVCYGLLAVAMAMARAQFSP